MEKSVDRDFPLKSGSRFGNSGGAARQSPSSLRLLALLRAPSSRFSGRSVGSTNRHSVDGLGRLPYLSGKRSREALPPESRSAPSGDGWSDPPRPSVGRLPATGVSGSIAPSMRMTGPGEGRSARRHVACLNDPLCARTSARVYGRTGLRSRFRERCEKCIQTIR